MFESFNGWFESMRFACEVQGVISMRLMRMAQGGPDAAVEANLMIAEKIDAFADAEVALAQGAVRRRKFHGGGRTRLRAGAPVRGRQQQPPRAAGVIQLVPLEILDVALVLFGGLA